MDSEGTSPLAGLLYGLTETIPAERVQAAKALGAMGEQARGGVPALLRALADPSSEVRAAVAWALYRIGADETAVPALLRGLRDESDKVRFASARALVKVTPSPVAATSALIEALLDRGPIADTAAWALRVMGPSSVPPLAAALNGENPRLHARAAAALSSSTVERARQAIPPLLAALTDPEAEVRLFATQSLGAIGQACRDESTALGGAWEEVPCALAARLSDSDAHVRERAAWALMWLGSEARPAVNELKAALHDADKRTREWAASALARIGENA